MIVPSGDAVPVLALNAGSSSVKFALVHASSNTTRNLLLGHVDSGDRADNDIHLRDADGKPIELQRRNADQPHGWLIDVAQLIVDLGLPSPAVIGHRIVHGGASYRAHTRIDSTVMTALEDTMSLAPLHVPLALELLRQTRALFPGVTQVGCLDTAFHRTMPAVARTLPIDQRWRAQGVERYGFHGLSCESILRQLGDLPPPRLVIAHLGHGASVTAVLDGQSVDTTMGLTPSGGVVMGTRCGDIDPGVLVYALRTLGGSADQLQEMINQRSGLLGLSGRSGDMRVLRAAAVSDPQARLAIDVFCMSVRKQIAAMAAVLGGIDLLVFTGGIGENDPATCAEICAGLEWLGVHFGRDRADTHARTRPLRGRTEGVDVRIMTADETQQIALHAYRLSGA